MQCGISFSACRSWADHAKQEGLRCGLQVLAASDFTSTRVVGLKRFISPSQSRPFCVSYPRSPSLIRSAHKAENRSGLGTASNYVVVGRAARAKLFAVDPVAVTSCRPERHCLTTPFCSQIAMLAPTWDSVVNGGRGSQIEALLSNQFLWNLFYAWSQPKPLRKPSERKHPQAFPPCPLIWASFRSSFSSPLSEHNISLSCQEPQRSQPRPLQYHPYAVRRELTQSVLEIEDRTSTQMLHLRIREM